VAIVALRSAAKTFFKRSRTMTSRHMRTLIGLLLLALTTANVVSQTSSGGSYQITSSVVAGGGGSSTGSGNKVIEGTAGQSAAGPSANGNISHVAGFWPTTPSLSAIQPGGQATFQFSAANYVVQEALTALAVTVTRTGDTSGFAAVDYTTVDAVAC